jgi:hypothetical protein
MKKRRFGEVIMRSLVKLFAISAAIVLLVIYHNDLGQKLSNLWADVSPSSMPHPLQQSVRNAGAAVNGVMNGVGHAFGQ